MLHLITKGSRNNDNILDIVVIFQNFIYIVILRTCYTRTCSELIAVFTTYTILIEMQQIYYAICNL
jgi:hypothetical protein